MKASMALGLADLSNGPSRESKRKLLTQGDINGPQVVSVVQHLIKKGPNQARNAIEASPKNFQVEKPRFRLGKEIVDTKANNSNLQASVKGKKTIARNRAFLTT